MKNNNSNSTRFSSKLIELVALAKKCNARTHTPMIEYQSKKKNMNRKWLKLIEWLNRPKKKSVLIKLVTRKPC